MNKESFRTVASELKNHVKILAGFVAIIWSIEIINYIVFRDRMALQFDFLGVRPRSIEGLVGILTAPFLHGNFYHVAANTVPFLGMGWFVLLRGTDRFFFVSVVSALISGLGSWAIGNPYSVHIGASGMIFGYLGYLLLSGWFEKNIVSIGLSLIAAFLYGGLIWGVLPGQTGISWEGHLFGFIGGSISAKLLAPQSSRNPQ